MVLARLSVHAKREFVLDMVRAGGFQFTIGDFRLELYFSAGGLTIRFGQYLLQAG
jgi:hypothetical protein